MSFITKVQFVLPSFNESFTKQFINYLLPVGMVLENGIGLKLSNANFFPKTEFIFKEIENPYVLFLFDENNIVTVKIENVTRVSKQSAYSYSAITMADFLQRIKSFPLVGLDHTGFNLPYFEGVHPKIVELREKLKNSCLYHTFPKHLEDAPWDFIIPGTRGEIDRSIPVDYDKTRKPKVEIVSFENSSIPLIQIDIQIKGTYDNLVKIFPEAIHIPEIKSMWVYIKNDYGIDICFVLNEALEEDWSYHFKKQRIG